MDRKPRLAFFQPRYAELPPFIQSHFVQHVDCLSCFFDVTVISGDCDYDKVCDTIGADLALFESGVYRREPIEIRNVHSNARIPKLGLLNADAYCVTRSLFLADMERWGIDTYFTISVAMGEHFPEIRDDLFVWANSIDPAVFKDYGIEKSTIALGIGSHASHYPWRTRINELIRTTYQAEHHAHQGWFDAQRAKGMVHGESYARLLNRAFFVPTCGTIAKEVVRKHFEIPGSRSCLVTERTAALEAAGFVDMENCIFADEHDVLDKIGALLHDPDLYERIVSAGYALAHSRHTMAARSEIYDWYRLRQLRKPGERIVQRRPFGGLQLIPERSDAGNIHVVSHGIDRALLEAANSRLRDGNISEADRLFRKVRQFHFMPEASLGLAECHLRAGRPYAALTASLEAIEALTRHYSTFVPDPVEWGYFIRSLLCIGAVREAIARLNQFPDLHHDELDRLKLVLGRFRPCSIHICSTTTSTAARKSVHHRSKLHFDDWLAELFKMMSACGQRRLAMRIASRIWSSEADLRHIKPEAIEQARDFPPVLKYYRARSLMQRTRHKLRRKVQESLDRAAPKRDRGIDGGDLVSTKGQKAEWKDRPSPTVR